MERYTDLALHNLSSSFLKSSNASLGPISSTNFDNYSGISLTELSLSASTIVLIIVSIAVFW